GRFQSRDEPVDGQRERQAPRRPDPMGESDLNSRGPSAISVGSSRGHDLDPGDKTKIAPATTRMLPVQAPVNILIVDDEPKNLTVLEAILDAPGYRLVRAESAEQA